MAIRIREVHIKAIVRDETQPFQQDKSVRSPPVLDVQTIVAMCVEQVMRKLKERDER